ncbi:MAG: hypothetical protein ACYTHK_17930 [Planctomycetota bacterium]|jgi:hypothetical protein
MRHLVLLLGLTLAACGGGGRDEIEPPIIIQTASLIPSVTIDTFATVDGTLIAGPGEGAGPFAGCGRIKSFSAYRTDTELVFRIEDEFGFCWDNDIYSVWIQNVTWRGVPNTQIFLVNGGDPTVDQTGTAIIRRTTAQGTQQAAENAITVRQWMDDPADGFFYMAIPLDVFSFYTEDGDSRSVFNVFAEIDRAQPNIANATSITVRDWTEPVAVDFVDFP